IFSAMRGYTGPGGLSGWGNRVQAAGRALRAYRPGVGAPTTSPWAVFCRSPDLGAIGGRSPPGVWRPGSAAVRHVGRSAAVDVGEHAVQRLPRATGGGVVDDGGHRPALAVVVPGDPGYRSDVAQGSGLDMRLPRQDRK